jgi:protein gp37
MDTKTRFTSNEVPPDDFDRVPETDNLGWPIHLQNRLLKESTKDSTAIGWTATVFPCGDYIRGYTFNAWLGCVKVAAECAFCYADLVAVTKLGRNLWGKLARRHFVGKSYWKRLDKWEQLGKEHGYQPKVFCHSMSDVFEILCEGHEDIPSMDAARERLFNEIERHPGLIFILCTKRPFNVLRLVPEHWRERFPENVWILATAGNQTNADKLIPELLQIPATVRGLSVEPMLGPIVLPKEFLDLGAGAWVICGGESGSLRQGIRPSHPDWYRALRDQCDAALVPFFFKQIGDWTHDSLIAGNQRLVKRSCSVAETNSTRVRVWPDGTKSYRLSKRANGRLLDGRQWNQFPEAKS